MNDAISMYNKFYSYLNEIEKKSAPKEIFWEGDFSLLLEGTRVSVVGSRNVSISGFKRARIITHALVERGITVVSGLAKGVDTVAHQTALSEGGRTIAVLGTPLNVASPISNTELLQEIKKNHLAISQFPLGSKVQRFNFPQRNKTMALVCDATIIIEASERSGTQHQGWEAIRLGRHVYLMENVVESVSWAPKMIEYGAEILTRENMKKVFSEIPNLTTVHGFDI